MLERVDKVARLLSLYGGILTERQRELCRCYFLDNLSLAEIAENKNVSRQAVHDSIERCLELLEKADSAMRLTEKSDRLSEIALELRKAVENAPVETAAIIADAASELDRMFEPSCTEDEDGF